MTLAVQQSFRVGDVISQSFQTTIRNIIPFGVLAIITVVIIVILYVIIGAIFGLSVASMTPGSMESGMGAPAIGVGFIVGILVFELLALAVYLGFMTAITYGTFQDLRGQPVGIGILLQSSIALVVPAIGTFIVLIGVFLAAAVVAIILNFIPILGQIAVLVMFVFLYIIFWVVIPVAVIERPGPVASLKRSIALTQGNRWKILGVFLVLFGIVVGGVIIAMIFSFISATIGGILVALLYVALGIYGAVLVAVGYHRLRASKEGADIGELAKVFD
jgi:hypothetical protein